MAQKKNSNSVKCLKEKISSLEKEVKIHKHFYEGAMRGWSSALNSRKEWGFIWFVYCLFLIVGFNILLILK